MRVWGGMGSSRTGSVQTQEASGVCKTAGRDRNGLDWVGAPSCGVRSERVAWGSRRGKEIGVEVLAGLQVPPVPLLVHRPRIRAQPRCRICRLLSSPGPADPGFWGTHPVPPPLRTQPAVPIFRAPTAPPTAHLRHRCLFTQMGEQGGGGGRGALLRETSLSETLPP